ncbi:FG-GAP repeat protein [Streptomyces sp. NPDC052107]|uniref:FG-GAP repeat protein n=1 Tax=Streptomyces sp. NPDC052107 TaxID=3155632 RepID=UPI00341F1728
MPGSGEEDDSFGEVLAAADLNKDGYSDLVVGNPTEHVGSAEYRGTVTIVRGSRSGPAAAATFGHTVHLRDLTGDGKADLAIGLSGGAVLLRGTSTIPTTSGAVHLTTVGGHFQD